MTWRMSRCFRTMTSDCHDVWSARSRRPEGLRESNVTERTRSRPNERRRFFVGLIDPGLIATTPFVT